MDAARVAQIESLGIQLRRGLLEALVVAALVSIGSYSMSGDLGLGPENRLAFRELGLSIGLRGLPKMRESMAGSKERTAAGRLLGNLNDLERFVPMGHVIEDFWTSAKNQKAATWMEHREINMVMLATTLEPDSFLSI